MNIDSFILQGHFELASGLHSDTYIDKLQIFSEPWRTAQAARNLAVFFCIESPTLVVGDSIGGHILASRVAEELRCGAAFTERRNGELGFFRGRAPKPAETVLIVDDVVTTGSTIKQLQDLVASYGARPLYAAALVDRGESSVSAIKYVALYKRLLPSFATAVCPFCSKGIPLTRRQR